MLLRHAIDYYLQRCQVTQKTKKSYSYVFNLLILFLEPEKEVEKITAVELDAFLDSRDGLSYGTINSHKRTLNVLFNYLVKKDICQKNPVIKVDSRKPNRLAGEARTSTIIKWIPKEDVFELLRNIKEFNYQHWLIALLLVDSGCRVSEALSVKKENFLGNRILLDKTKNGKMRWLVFPNELGQAIQEYSNTHNSPYLFPAAWDVSTHTTYWSFENTFSKAREGIKNVYTKKEITIHQLRHTFITNCSPNAGGTMKLKMLSGHTSEQALNIYIHANPVLTEKVYEELVDFALSPGILDEKQLKCYGQNSTSGKRLLNLGAS